MMKQFIEHQKSLETIKDEDGDEIMASANSTRAVNLKDCKEIFKHQNSLINVIEEKDTNKEINLFSQKNFREAGLNSCAV